MSRVAGWENPDGSQTLILTERADFPGTATGPVRHGEATHPSDQGLRSVPSLVMGQFAHLTSPAIEAVRRRERERTAPMFPGEDYPTARIPRGPAPDRLASRVWPYPTGGAA